MQLLKESEVLDLLGGDKMDIDGKVRESVTTDSKYVMDVVNALVEEHTDELDKMVERIHEDLRQDVTFTDEQLSKMVLEMNTLLYNIIDPNLGIDIREEISHMKQKSDYALARQTASGTVADKDNEAWLATQDISVLNLIYKESNKLMKSKLDRASELLLSLKKILTFRIQQMSGMSDQ